MFERHRPLIVIGHSHSVALQQAHEDRVAAGRAEPDSIVFASLRQPPFDLVMVDASAPSTGREPSPAAAAAFEALLGQPASGVVLMLDGNEHTMFSMFEPLGASRPTDVDWPESGVATLPDAITIPIEMVRAELRHRMVDTFALTRWLAARSVHPLITMPPPPPVSDPDHVRAHPGVFADRIDELVLSRPEYRYKCWLLTVEFRRQLAAEVDAAFLESDPRFLDGFWLASQFRRPDPSHGNAAYGEIWLDTIERHLATPGAQHGAHVSEQA